MRGILDSKAAKAAKAAAPSLQRGDRHGRYTAQAACG